MRNQETIAECRRACGGHGYSYHSGFGALLDHNDIHCTWEGDNHVLMMQCQRFVLKMLRAASQGKDLPETLEHLALAQFEKPTFEGSLDSIEDLSQLFKQISSYLTIKAAAKLTTGEGSPVEKFLKAQNYELRYMCESYHDVYMVESYKEWLGTFTCEKTRKVFGKMLLLFIHKRITESTKHYLPVFGEEVFEKIEQSIVDLCEDLRNEIVQITELLPVANIYSGAFGNQDLQIYDRFIQHYMATPGSTERPSWWKKIYQNN
jgi:acyl-CoA oxidase